MREQKTVIVYNAEWQRYQRETISYEASRETTLPDPWMSRMKWNHVELPPSLAAKGAFRNLR